MRLIDADRVLGYIDRILAQGTGKKKSFEFIRKYVANMPTIDIVQHGRWIEENRRPKSSQFYCSECHRTAYDIQPTRAEGWVKRCRYAYCPNCGAKMDEEEDG